MTGAEWLPPRSDLQVIPLAQLNRDRFSSRLGVFGVFIRADGHVPTGSRIGTHLDLKPFFGKSVPNHFRQFFVGGLAKKPVLGLLWLLHGLVRSFVLLGISTRLQVGGRSRLRHWTFRHSM